MSHFKNGLLIVFILLAGAVSSATVRNVVIKGKIVSFTKEYVSVKSAATMVETKVPRSLFVKEIQSGENVVLELTSEQFEEVQKLNRKK
jgi:hypothetical protein